MKNLVQKFLAFLARAIIEKYQPKIIGITGSVGKTSTKEAIFFVVSQKYNAYRPSKNLNNEFGLPLAIIGFDTPGKSIFGWLQVFLKAISLVLFKQAYPQVLVLEYGVDRVGDMDYLISIARPNISVITNIGVSHYEFFKTPEAIFEEKTKLAHSLKDDEYLIINSNVVGSDNKLNSLNAKILRYGSNSESDINYSIISEQANSEVFTKLNFITPSRKFELRINALGKPHIEAAAAAVSVAESLWIETDLIQKGLLEYKPAPGRLNLIAGIKGSLIIDDTYNASPDSMREAIRLLDKLEATKKIAVLGTMRELGNLTESAHKDIGGYVASIKPNYLITVGDGGQLIRVAAIEAGMPSDLVMHFQDSDEAKKTIQDLIESDTLILVKGSQFVRLEKIVKEIMAEPMRASELLCRQYGDWLKD
jgi:UDP-N-acetylmuramoyl-tripeptide--D-alanyl-D-alanine ligase